MDDYEVDDEWWGDLDNEQPKSGHTTQLATHYSKWFNFCYTEFNETPRLAGMDARYEYATMRDKQSDTATDCW